MLLAVTVTLLSGLLAVWGVITLAFFGIWLYHSTLSLHEEDTLFLDKGESHLIRAQAETFAKMDKVRPYMVGSLSASLGLGVVIAGVWIFQQLTFVH